MTTTMELPLEPVILACMVFLFIVAAIIFHLYTSEQYWKRVATIDPLTGVLNRRAFFDKARNVVASSRYQHISLLFLDIDCLKIINDTMGHATGDLIIKSVAAHCLANTKSDTDLVCRYGGDEFIVLLPGAKADQASAIARRILARLKQTWVQTGQLITGSVGVVSTDYDDQIGSGCTDFFEFVKRADEALLHAKKHKNCVQLYADLYAGDSSKDETIDSEKKKE